MIKGWYRWSREMISRIYNYEAELKSIRKSIRRESCTLAWNDTISGLNRRRVCTAEISTDLWIISWVGLQIASVLGLQWAHFESLVTEFRSHEWVRNHYNTQPDTERKGINTHTPCMYIPTYVRHSAYTHVYTHIRVYTQAHTRTEYTHIHTTHTFIYKNPYI